MPSSDPERRRQSKYRRDDYDRDRYPPRPERSRTYAGRDEDPYYKPKGRKSGILDGLLQAITEPDRPRHRSPRRDVRGYSDSESESSPPPRRRRRSRERSRERGYGRELERERERERDRDRDRDRARGPRRNDYDNLEDDYLARRRQADARRPRDDGYYSDTRYDKYRSDPYRDDRDRRDRYRDDKYRDERYRDDRRDAPRRRPGPPERRESKWQKEAKDMFVKHAVPVIKAEGTKFLSKQIGNFLAKSASK